MKTSVQISQVIDLIFDNLTGNFLTVEQVCLKDEFGDPISNSHNTYADFDMDKVCAFPEHELFIYCVLLERPEMAKIFWAGGQNEMCAALAASKIFKSYAEIFEENELNESSNEFEMLATDILEKCFDDNQEDAQLLLLREIPEYGRKTSLQIAVSANCKNFVSSVCCQSLLVKIWYGQIIPDTSKFNLGLCVLMPLLAPFLINLDNHKNKLKLEILASNSLFESSREKSNDLEMSSWNHRADSKKPKNKQAEKESLSYPRQVVSFFRAPFVKFVYNQITFLLFLILFSYFILCDFYPIKQKTKDGEEFGDDVETVEIVHNVWVLIYTLDEIHLLYKSDVRFKLTRLVTHFSDFWSLVQTFSIVFYVIALVLRYLPGYECYLAARIILSLDIILWFLRSLHAYSCVRTLGPKLFMIREMIKELMYFILIVLVFILAYGVSTQSLMYHNQEFNMDLLKNVFFPAYFVIGGEYYEREKMLEADSCAGNETGFVLMDKFTQDGCPEKYGTKVSLGLLVVYIIMLNILLVNLLIAIFSNTYSEIEQQADKIWKFQRYSLVYEYFQRPFLPSPLTIFYYIVSFIRKFFLTLARICFDTIKPDRNVKSFRLNYHRPVEEERLRYWETYISDEVVTRNESKSKETQEYKIQQNVNKLDLVNSKLDELFENKDELHNQINDLEKKLDTLLNLLDKKPKEKKVVEPSIVLKKEENIENLRLFARNDSLNSADLVSVLSEEDESRVSRQITDNNRSIYPDSNVHRFAVPENKRSWEVKWPNYAASNYTARKVLYDKNADVDLLSLNASMRPFVNFNSYDRVNDVDRTSCLGEYSVFNGLPLNPKGRTGLEGRGSLLFWGPNQALELIFTRYKRDLSGEIIYNDNNQKIVEFIAVQSVADENEWQLPWIFQVPKESNDSFERRVFNSVFDDEIILEYEDIKPILKNPITISRYFKDSVYNTDHAWVEILAMNFQDNFELFKKFYLKKNLENKVLRWKEIDDVILSKQKMKAQILKKVVKLLK